MIIKATSMAPIQPKIARDKDSIGTLPTWLAINKLAPSGGSNKPDG